MENSNIIKFIKALSPTPLDHIFICFLIWSWDMTLPPFLDNDNKYRVFFSETTPKGLFLCSAYLNTCSVHHKCVTWAGRCGGNTTKHFLTANIFVKSVQVGPPVWWEMLMPGLLFPICFGKKSCHENDTHTLPLH